MLFFLQSESILVLIVFWLLYPWLLKSVLLRICYSHDTFLKEINDTILLFGKGVRYSLSIKELLVITISALSLFTITISQNDDAQAGIKKNSEELTDNFQNMSPNDFD